MSLVRIFGDRDFFGRGRLRGESVLGKFSRVGIHDGVMSVPLALFHQLDTLCANFHSIDQCFGRERFWQTLQRKELIS